MIFIFTLLCGTLCIVSLLKTETTQVAWWRYALYCILRISVCLLLNDGLPVGPGGPLAPEAPVGPPGPVAPVGPE